MKSPLYREEAFRFQHQMTEQDILLKKAIMEEGMNTPLAKEKIISKKEFFDIQMEVQRQASSRKAVPRRS